MMSNEKHIEEAAKRLREAEENKMVCPPIRDILGETDLNAAYKVQALNANIRRQKGDIAVGSKIGLTAPIVQQKFGIDQPDFGLLWQASQIQNDGTISVRQLMQPKAEAEIAFILKKDLNAEYIEINVLREAIEYAQASIEIVGSRIQNWDIKITDTIADNASASHWVLGDQKVKLEELDLLNCKMKMTNQGALVSEGKGSNCLGSPLLAAQWLANKMIEMNNPLKAGDIILTGALGPMVDIKEGDNFAASIEGLGSVRVGFTK